jgi:hypothetical protein
MKKQPFSGAKDQSGTVYLTDDGKIVREVSLDYDFSILEKKSVIQSMKEGILVQTENTCFNGREVLLHNRVDPFTYPSEWSFDMYKDAGLLILELQNRLSKDGLTLKDAHAYNVSFIGVNPVFIDFGSIQKIQVCSKKWEIYRDFKAAFPNILSVWRRQGHLSALGYINLGYKYTASSKLGKLWDGLGSAVYMPTEIIEKKIRKRLFAPGASFIIKAFSLVHPRFWMSDNKLLKRKLKKIKKPVKSTHWADYHKKSNLLTEPSPRFKTLASIIKQLNINTALELAGNQGAFSKYLESQNFLKNILCTDNDANAINSAYIYLKDSKSVNLMVYDFCNPYPVRCRQEEIPYKADIVIALAVIHHLVLTQNYLLPYVLERIFAHSQKYVMTEFMPLGLWDGEKSPPIPEWYSKKWFERHLKDFSDIILIEQTEKNRIAYLCKKKVFIS